VTQQIPEPPVPPVPPGPPDIPFDPNLFLAANGPVVVMIVIAGLVAATVILWPIVRALARWLEPRAREPAVRAEVEQLRARLGEVDALGARVLELEERLDFAERLLTQRREPDRLGAERPEEGAEAPRRP
jgi:hypothetical protein